MPLPSQFVHSDLRQNVIAYLKSDAVLVTLVGGQTDNIMGEHQYQEIFNNLPLLVVTDGQFVENNRFQEDCKRYGVQPMTFECYDLLPSSQATEDVLNRVSSLLRDSPLGNDGRKAVSSANVGVFWSNPKQGYQEFYDEAVRLSGKRLVVEFTVVMMQT